MTCSQFFALMVSHWLAISFIVGYVGLTCMNHLPDTWTGFNPYFRDVCRSLAASSPAQRFEAKYNITTADGTSKTQTVSAEQPKP